MQAISQWYISLGNYTFPTVFVKLGVGEKQMLTTNASPTDVNKHLITRIDRAISALPGACFIGLDSCAPDDSPIFKRRKAQSSGKGATELLKSSEKVKKAIQQDKCSTIIVRPYRRMDKAREFRLFVFEGVLAGMSQRHLIRHFRRLEGKKTEYWEKAVSFLSEISQLIHFKNVVIDIYFTSDKNILIIDMNEWGTCDPLMFRKWQRDWRQVDGLKLMAEPIQMNGDVKVSF